MGNKETSHKNDTPESPQKHTEEPSIDPLLLNASTKMELDEKLVCDVANNLLTVPVSCSQGTVKDDMQNLSFHGDLLLNISDCDSHMNNVLLENKIHCEIDLHDKNICSDETCSTDPTLPTLQSHSIFTKPYCKDLITGDSFVDSPLSCGTTDVFYTGANCRNDLGESSASMSSTESLISASSVIESGCKSIDSNELLVNLEQSISSTFIKEEKPESKNQIHTEITNALNLELNCTFHDGNQLEADSLKSTQYDSNAREQMKPKANDASSQQFIAVDDLPSQSTAIPNFHETNKQPDDVEFCVHTIAKNELKSESLLDISNIAVEKEPVITTGMEDHNYKKECFEISCSTSSIKFDSTEMAKLPENITGLSSSTANSSLCVVNENNPDDCDIISLSCSNNLIPSSALETCISSHENCAPQANKSINCKNALEVPSSLVEGTLDNGDEETHIGMLNTSDLLKHGNSSTSDVCVLLDSKQSLLINLNDFVPTDSLKAETSLPSVFYDAGLDLSQVNTEACEDEKDSIPFISTDENKKCESVLNVYSEKIETSNFHGNTTLNLAEGSSYDALSVDNHTGSSEIPALLVDHHESQTIENCDILHDFTEDAILITDKSKETGENDFSKQQSEGLYVETSIPVLCDMEENALRLNLLDQSHTFSTCPKQDSPENEKDVIQNSDPNDACEIVTFFENKYSVSDNTDVQSLLFEQLPEREVENKSLDRELLYLEKDKICDFDEPELHFPLKNKETNFEEDERMTCLEVNSEPMFDKELSEQCFAETLNTEELPCEPSVIASEKKWDDEVIMLNDMRNNLIEQNESLRSVYADTVKYLHESLMYMQSIMAKKEKEICDSLTHQKSIMKERDQALEDFQNVEKAFSELLVRYEKTKVVLEHMKENDTIQKELVENLSVEIKEQEQKYNLLQTRAKEKLSLANEELLKITKEKEAEKAALTAMIRKAEIKARSLNITLEQIENDNDELARMCDEFANKYST